VATLASVHDGRHRLPADPEARESLVWTLQLPDEGVAAFVHSWVDGAGRAGTFTCAYGPAVGAPIFEVVDGLPVPDDQGFHDWRVGPLHVCQGASQAAADVTFDGERVGLDYHFAALHPAYAYGGHPRGCPPFLAADRLEQSGRVTGVLRIDARQVPFDTFGHREHSWGTCDWSFPTHWVRLEAQAEPGIAVHALQVDALGRRELRGYVVKDGLMAEITALDLVTELDERVVHDAVMAAVVDDAGRITDVRLERFGAYDFEVHPLATLNEVSMRASIDGHRGAGHAEMMWLPEYLARHRRGRHGTR
jgi:hypothetical protein